ncbi:lysylphosphatidylglycerol synthase transmembrane domain-containing protein [Tellurirhabdus bombi]|uniref:lysylphosphatidylglycerol synthase transmembrane domain-containing protein n=1 Tax=Tellurirhabdus bombi TaxID=2907205 RepID=UPI001F3D6BFF|nr:lysylphosphatidylglycerol synthase transmembrane domain-containing protein [Tellurirhabdus bombi]
MQDKEFYSLPTHKRSQKIIFWVKIAILTGVVGFVAYTFHRQQHDWRSVLTYWQRANWASFSGVALLLLIPLNWALEARKWQILAQRVARISFWEAYQGVLAGLSMSFALPSQVGDTAGRLLSLRTARRWEGLGASLVAGGMQFYVALFFGFLSLLILRLDATAPTSNALFRYLFWPLLGLLALGLLVASFRKRLATSAPRWLKPYEKYWSVAAYYTSAELIHAFLIASLRHLTFTVQFALALQLFGIELSFRDMFSGIGLVYLGKTIIPAFNLLSDLGVREAASLFVFSQWAVPAPQVLSATLTLWLINVLIPVLVGLIGVWKLKPTNA